jgi:uncharacterized repeat protein (TIGR01451 family)
VTNTPTNTPTATFTSTPTSTPTPVVTVVLKKNASNANPSSGDQETYTIQANIFNNSAKNIVVWDTIPTGLTYAGGITPNGQVIPLPTPGSSSTGTLLVWNLGSESPGSYTFSYRATVNQLILGGTVITNWVAWQDLEEPTPLLAQAPITITGAYTIKIGIYNESGEEVKQILETQLSQPLDTINLEVSSNITTVNGTVTIYYQGVNLGTWNGTNTQGQLVTNGQYYVKVDNIDPEGAVTSVTKAITVDRALQTITVLVYNESGEVVRHLYETNENYSSTNNITAETVSSTVLVPSTAMNSPLLTIQWINNSGAVIGTTTWDGRNDAGEIVTNGEYFIAVVSSTGTGANVSLTKEVTINGTGENLGQVYAAPNILNHGNSLLNLRVIPPAGAGNWTISRVRVYDVSGELVDEFAGSPGSNSASYNLSTLASGLYLVVVNLEDAQGHLLGHQIIQIVIQH